MELRIGIDASINSTGIVVMEKEVGKIELVKYYLLVPNVGEGKKLPKCTSSAELRTYERHWEAKTSTYSQQDIYKILSAENQSKEILRILTKEIMVNQPDKVSCRIEGSLMSSSFKSGQSRLNDLIAFGSVMRYELLKSGLITEFKIIPPKTLKKLATGNGNAKKGLMVSHHKDTFPELNFDYNLGKVDDIIDAFWLAYVEDDKNKISVEEFNHHIV